MAHGTHGTRGWAWLAGISILALLVSFDRAVHQVVAQGESRRAAERERTSTHFRCQLMTSAHGRAECRVALR